VAITALISAQFVQQGGSGGLGGNEAPAHQRGDAGGIGGQTPEIVEELADGNPRRPRGARDSGHRIRDRPKRRGGGHGQLVRKPAQDQPEPRDRVIGPLDPLGVLVEDHHAGVAHVLAPPVAARRTLTRFSVMVPCP